MPENSRRQREVRLWPMNRVVGVVMMRGGRRREIYLENSCLLNSLGGRREMQGSTEE